MAGDWIKMRDNLATDPRIMQMARRLKCRRTTVIGACFMLWAQADEHTRDGRMDGSTKEAVDELCEMDGFADAMEAVGWLAAGPEGVEIPRFDEHNGRTARRRAADSIRKTSARYADKKRTGAPQEQEQEQEQEPAQMATAKRCSQGDEYTGGETSDAGKDFSAGGSAGRAGHNGPSAVPAPSPDSAVRMVRAKAALIEVGVSKANVGRAVVALTKLAADGRDPLATITGLRERAASSDNPAGYVYAALLGEAGMGTREKAKREEAANDN